LLGAPPAGEGGYGNWRQPDGVYDTQVLEAALGAGLAKQVLGDLESGCRLRGREQAFGVAAVIETRRTLADHGLTKILVLA